MILQVELINNGMLTKHQVRESRGYNLNEYADYTALYKAVFEDFLAILNTPKYADDKYNFDDVYFYKSNTFKVIRISCDRLSKGTIKKLTGSNLDTVYNSFTGIIH